jgi:hypothetical protein
LFEGLIEFYGLSYASGSLLAGSVGTIGIMGKNLLISHPEFIAVGESDAESE